MRYTVDHEFIRQWIEYWGGFPGLYLHPHGEHRHITVQFGPPTAEIEHISWTEFFDWFEGEQLALGVPDEENVDPREIGFSNRAEVPLFGAPVPVGKKRSKKDVRMFEMEKWEYDKPHRE